MKSVSRLLFISIFIISCNKTALEKEFSCSSESFNGNTEKVIDVKKSFSIQIPKHWKTNLFFDKMQSSIYSADTTKQLTETVLIDITQLQIGYQFDARFKKQLTLNDSIQKLKNKHQNAFKFKNKNAYYAISSGKKGNFTYQILNIFAKQNDTNSFHLKTEIYGNSDINKRFCKAIHILNSITFNEP
jgi:hypothetical protein